MFVEDYSVEVGRELVQGVDVWLNNPKRGEEACGTCGMKAGINGVLNLSILDGWFDEGYEISGGWAIGDREPYTEDQDEIHASAIYSLLENEIVPMFYGERDRGIPEEWMRRVKQSLMGLSPQFNCLRMVGEYTAQLYQPATGVVPRGQPRQFRAGAGAPAVAGAGARGMGPGTLRGGRSGIEQSGAERGGDPLACSGGPGGSFAE